MANYRKRYDFVLLLDFLEKVTQTLASAGVKDAIALVKREEGLYNLQGHAMRVMPLAIWLAIHRPDLLSAIRGRTKLSAAMTGHSSEARDTVLWKKVQVALKVLILSNGGDILVKADKSNTPTTAANIANTYLSAAFGGGQTTGGAGNTVLKRSLKLLAHILPL